MVVEVNGYKIEPGANLSGANLTYANLSNADLSNANLTSANLSSTILSSANLSNANMTDSYRNVVPPKKSPTNRDGDDYEDNYENDYGDNYESCVGDCNDMDNDGRTWDDIDGDGDGRYESR